MNITLLLIAAIQAGTPLLLATLGETITEKAGHLNLGVEGMMLVGAVMGFVTAFETQNAGLAILVAMLAGLAASLIYAFLTVSLRTNQIVTGLALTIFGTGVSSFIGSSYIGEVVPANVKLFLKSSIEIPLLSKIPFVGDILFKQDILVYLSIIITVFFGIYLYKSRIGLNLKAVGENPYAADAVGINVSLYKYIHILIGGALSGLAGGYISLVYIPVWQDNVVAGKGWIAVALVIFVSWNPYKAILGSYFFGLLDIIGFRLQKFELHIPQDIIDMLPYIATIVVLIITSIRPSIKNNPPHWLGREYFREDR
ncbi:MAG: ABC transporter permease [Clostridia bacterium]|nr:ABC transporter permease [Clostridia bacterium]